MISPWAGNKSENVLKEHCSDEENLDMLTKPVRLSAFFKELKEAENDPIPEVKHTEFIETSTSKEDLLELEEVEPPTRLKDNLPVIHNNDEEIHNQLSNSNLLLNKCHYTPAKQPQYNTFLTPNVFVNPYHRGSLTEVQNNRYSRTQPGTLTATRTASSAISLMNSHVESSKQKALFLHEQMKKNNIIYEDENENKENTKEEGNTSSKVLCTVPIEKLALEPFEKLVVKEREYIILNQIGRGGSSVVFHCYDPIDKYERAIKKVSLSGDRACVEGYINEVKMLYKLQNCDRIIRLFSYEIKKDEKKLLMVLEKGEKDLGQILKELSISTEHLPIYMVFYYWMEILYAVKQIHENGIIHADLKPANFLMVSSKLKLIDFGIASSLQNDMTSVVKNVLIGSFNYISPEALINSSKDGDVAKFKVNFKSDVWSLGCILYQLIYRKTPFYHIGNTYAKISAIIDPKHVIDYPNANWLPVNIIDVMRSCLQYDVKLRPSVTDLIDSFERMIN